MAKKMKTGAAAPSAEFSIDEDVLRGAIEEANSRKDMASSYMGEHGAYVKEFTEKHNINRKAFGFIRHLDKQTDQGRADILRQFVGMATALGFFDQPDLLGPGVPPPSVAKPKPDSTLGDMIDGDEVGARPH